MEVAKTLRHVNKRIAIHTFASGLENIDLRTKVKARNYQSLSEAIQGAKDEENPDIKNIQYQRKKPSGQLQQKKTSNGQHTEDIILPPRCEIIKFVSSELSEDCIIKSEEVSEGVYIAGLTVRPNTRGEIPLKFLNTRETEVTLKNFRPKLEVLSNYEICNMGKVDNLSVEASEFSF
ncbi:hypothetical protein WA026_016798 [Henosepilachna vigintioctopunctata]|uniref:Uncharacterized protein n=1 Tax=Henosepilachna vigintioctopunctata TaxID=420089 RepID=A0AAW1V199_9CUCU